MESRTLPAGNLGQQLAAMHDRERRAFAAYSLASGLLPDESGQPFRRPHDVIPNTPRARFLRALEFLGLGGARRSRAAAARAAGLKRGTVAAWCSRDPKFREEVDGLVDPGPWNAVDLEEDEIFDSEMETVGRLLTLPDEEIARVAAGEIPSRRLMRAAFPPSSPTGADHDERFPGWDHAFPTYGDNEGAST